MNGNRSAIKRLAAALAVALLLLSCPAPAMAEVFSAIVTVDGMAVYGEASMSRQVATLDKNTVVRVTGYSTSIAKISYDGKTGYAKISDMKTVDEAATKAVVSAAAPVYKAPQDESQSIKVPAGTQLYVLARSGDWSMVEKNGYVGYMKSEALTQADANWATPSAAPTDAASTNASGITIREYVAVTLEKTTVYKSASAKAKSIGTLPGGTEVTVQAASSDGWAFIEVDGKRGFCKLASLREGVISATLAPEASPAAKQGTSAAVSVNRLAVYKSASTQSKKLGTLKKGQIVNVVETQGSWAYIELNGNYGYCAAKGVATDDSGVPSGFKQANASATVVSDQARVYASTSIDAESAALKLGAEVQVYAYNETWACIVQGGRYGFVPVKLLSKKAYETIDSDGTALQTLLKALLAGGYYDAVPSTSYNAAAIAAIKRFQSACGLEQSGVADETTQRILYGGYAPVSGMLYKAMSSGDKSDSVSRLQARLYALGYLTKTTSLDGEYGATTVNAVKLFQSASGISATGAADTATLKALYSTEAKGLPAGSKAADASSAASSGSGSSSSYLDSVPSGLASTTGSYSQGMSKAEALEYVIYLAQSKLGCPYVYGATGPDKFDCSGLTTWAFKAVGVSLKRSAYAQGYDETYAKIEGVENLKRGDIVFFNTISDSDLSDHAGIYLGSGYFIHASSGGHRVVVSSITSGYYNRVFSWGRRVL